MGLNDFFNTRLIYVFIFLTSPPPLTGSPISTPSHSPLPRTPTTSTPVHGKQSSASVLNNPYIIVDKPGGMAASSAASAGTLPPSERC